MLAEHFDKELSMSAAQDDYFFDTLRKVQVFRYLSDEALREILKISDVIHYKTDDKIISEGEHSQYLYAVFIQFCRAAVADDRIIMPFAFIRMS